MQPLVQLPAVCATGLAAAAGWSSVLSISSNVRPLVSGPNAQKPITPRIPGCEIEHRKPLPKAHRQNRAGRDHRGLCRPTGSTPERRLRRAQFGSYGLFSGHRSSSTDERTQDLRTLSRNESRDVSRKPWASRHRQARSRCLPRSSIPRRAGCASGRTRTIERDTKGAKTRFIAPAYGKFESISLHRRVQRTSLQH